MMFSLWIPGDSRIAPPGILNFKDYEPQETNLIKMLASGKNFYDIGANIGWYAINIAKSIKVFMSMHLNQFRKHTNI